MFSAVLDCHCVTYDEDTRFTFAGACFDNRVNNAISGDVIYHAIIDSFSTIYLLSNAILALIVLIVIVGVPTMVLVLYPLQFFQKISTYTINWHFIHVFVDSFQGCYTRMKLSLELLTVVGIQS